MGSESKHHSKSQEFVGATLRTGELASALRGIGEKLFPGQAPRVGLELIEQLPDGSTRTTRGTELSLVDHVCVLGGSLNPWLTVSWYARDSRRRLLYLDLRGDKKLLSLLPTAEYQPTVHAVASASEPRLMYAALDELRVVLGLRNVEAPNEASAFLVSVSPTSPASEPTVAPSLPGPAQPKPITHREHIKGLWVVIAAIVTALGAVAAAYISAKWRKGP